jgi:lipoprotein NlpD
LLLYGTALFVAAGCSTITDPVVKGPGWYLVKPSDTLYSISWRYGLDYRELAQWNGLGEPYRIYPGQQLILIKPDQLPSSPTTTAQAPAQSPSGVRAIPLPQAPSKATTGKKPQTQSAQSPSLPNKPVTGWRWPTAGPVLNRFSYRDLDRRGIDIAGKIGQPVYAVAAGKVVYSGDGLSGYRNLIIIKHNDTFLSAYAYNKSILAKEGELVKKGDLIAKMGQGKEKQAALHFQIRKNGKPVDPLMYLPER